MMNENNRLIHIFLIAIILCVSSLDLATKSLDFVLKSSAAHSESILSVSSNYHQNCDETKDSSCSSSVFITIIQSLSYSPNLALQKQKANFTVIFDSILLDVPKRPPRLI